MDYPMMNSGMKIKLKNMNKKTLYQFIAHSTKHGFSLREIGKMVGVSHSYIHQIYHSDGEPKKIERKLCSRCEAMLKELKLDK